MYSETLEENECRMADACADEITNGCVEEDPTEDPEEIGGNLSFDRGIFGGGEGGGGAPVTWRNRFFNQKTIDPYSCFYFASITALANTFDVEIPQSVIEEGWKDLVASGCFTPRVGWTMTNGAESAAKHFNQHFGKSVRAIKIPFSVKNVVAALQSGSCFVFGIRYGAEYAKNEQDDGIIQNTAGTKGGNGHLVCGVKANTLDDSLMKFAESYHGLIAKEIILVDIDELSGLFMNNLIYFK